jgi:rod shape determining protein RodA
MGILSGEHIDTKTVGTTIALVVIGLVSIYSATYDAGASAYFFRQIWWAVAGLVLMASIIVMPFRMLQMLSYPIYALSILMLVGVMVIGKTIAGSTSWFGVGGFGVQPSEIAKPATVLALAAYLSNRQVTLKRSKHIVATFLLVLLPMGLVLAQPDIGTAVVYGGMLVPVLYWAGASPLLLLSLTAPAIAAVAALFGVTPFLIVIVVVFLALFLLRENRLHSAIVFSLTVLVGVSVQYMYGKLAPYQQKRIETFLSPEVDPLGAGYNVIQSKIAIGSGGILGKGYLQGTQTQLNFIPAQWTDFIFCVPSEEFGFLGASIILLLLIALLVRGVSIASMAKSRYASLVAVGIVGVFAVHVVINIGMSMGLMPVIGVPLPFLSYGGSSLMTSMLMSGLLANMYLNRKEY